MKRHKVARAQNNKLPRGIKFPRGDLSEESRVIRTAMAHIVVQIVVNKFLKTYNDAKEAEAAREREREVEEILPWRLEQKVACCLHPIKLPLIIVITILGCAIENRINWTTTEEWRAGIPRPGPVCYVHRLNSSISASKTFHLPPKLVDPINSTINGISDRLGANGTEIHLIPETVLLHFERDTCGVKMAVTANGTCVPKLEDTHGYRHTDSPSHFSGLGLNRIKMPFIYFSLLWGIYKSTFLPIHWPDRLLLAATGGFLGKEPVFKLLMQPYFSRLTGLTDVMAKIGLMFRYIMLPNSLLTALMTMGHERECPDLYYYVMDMYLGQFIYFWCLFDLFFIIILYLFFQICYRNRVIGTCAYRFYKVWWHLTTPITFILFIIDLCTTLDYRFWQDIYLAIVLVFSWEFSFSFFFAVDFAQLLGKIVIVLDTLQIVVLILALVCPKCGYKLPVVGKYMKQDDEADEEERKDLESKALLENE